MSSFIRSFFACAFVFLALSAQSFTAFSAEKTVDTETMDVNDFMSLVRHAPRQETWSKLEGTVMHKRDGAKRVKFPVRLGVRFTPTRVLAQLTFNGDETYNVTQAFTEPPVATLDTDVADTEKSKLSLCGIAADDLTMGFLFNPVIRELEKESIKTQTCRVVVLKARVDGEFAKVFISCSYLFPMKVQWFKEDPANENAEPYREMEIASVKQESDYWIVSELRLAGPSWRTIVDFDKTSVGPASTMPNDLFR